MKPLLLLLALLAGNLCAAPDDDATVAARKAALGIAGAWSNDGFKLRDGYWSGVLKPGAARIVQVNLYAGNQYWFTLATGEKGKKVTVTVFDESGKPMTTEPYHDGPHAAAGFSPTASGPYLVKVEMLEGESAAFALIYSYK